MRKNTTKYIARLAMFLAMGIALNILESFIPIPLPIPGIKLGLANTMGLIVLYFYSPKEYLSLGFLRVLLVALLRTGLGSPAFFLSLAGWALSSILALLAYYFIKPSIYGLSTVSALFHPFGQVIMACILYQNILFLNYLPLLLVSGLITGIIVAFISSKAIKTLEKFFK